MTNAHTSLPVGAVAVIVTALSTTAGRDVDHPALTGAPTNALLTTRPTDPHGRVLSLGACRNTS